MRNTTVTDEEGAAGYRTDGLDLIQEYLDRNAQRRARYVWNAVNFTIFAHIEFLETFNKIPSQTDLRAINANEVDYLLGLFEYDTLMYNRDVVDNGYEDREPTLSEMTDKAIDVLSKNANGFFLFVEGQKIDSAHHSNYARLSLDETLEFAKAVEVAKNKVNEDDTLIVVTSDHSHTVSYNGYGVSSETIYITRTKRFHVLLFRN